MKKLKIVDSVIMEKENYKSITYEYDKKTDIVVTKADNQFGNLENITLVTKTVKIIPYHAFVNFLTDGNKKVEITLKFNTPIYLDEKNQIDQLFKYYQELEDFLNVNYEKLWLIE